MSIASINNYKKLAKKLIDLKANLEIQSDQLFTPILIASQKGNQEIVELLIKNGADVNAKNKEGESSLILASQYGHQEIVELLIKAGADLECLTIEQKNSILINASQNNNFELIPLLIKAGADINAKDQDGMTPLIHASRMGHLKVVEDLINAGAKIYEVNNKKMSSLMYAARSKDNLEIVKKLIAKAKEMMTTQTATETEDQDKNSETKFKKELEHSLYFAVKNNNPEIIRLILEENITIVNKGYDKKIKDTALILAVKENYKEAVTELLKSKNLEIDKKNLEGKTALDYAIENKNHAIISLLKEFSLSQKVQELSLTSSARTSSTAQPTATQLKSEECSQERI